ncbi:hypothetical protein COLO4_17486 [Corchorus olitorius]|uniref:non-specific serine/threonine protein kinase n=1 Tax=Corchorus olitorius TaxID=93759 RepID=A0A1R3JCJ4_9ROSI|nr:hypothetical protein COLO4_17486 [Corchorus olitorius]
MKTLILRSCNLIGQLPEYLGDMTKLKVLDLSFNKLSGEIPSSSSGLMDVDYLYLTRNLLTGSIPSWMLEKGDNVDLSYNNFTAGTPGTSSCQQRSVNLFSSTSPSNTSSFKSVTISYVSAQYSLHINCGGREETVGGTIYEDDRDGAGPSKFFQSRTNWAFSSTGHFLDDDRPTDTYIWTNTSKLPNMNGSQLYTHARLSPISLTYYGFCLGNGNYTVNLHFAEIMFTNDNTYNSLGRRIFDIYLQSKLVKKDFNIEDEAGGVGKAVIKNFTAAVTNGILEIRLHWAGKGTTGIPVRGVYGPLISAISVDPADFIPPSENEGRSGISVGAVVGIVAGAAFAIFLIVVILWWIGCFKRKSTLEQELKGLDLQTGSFSLRQIKSATNNFDAANKIGEGGFGPVYKGLLSDGTVIAVKQLSAKSKQGNREFVNEIGMISALQHPHLPCSGIVCGYMAPEYAMRGYLTDKADVYSFGIVALEIVSGRSNTCYRPKEECFYLLDWALAVKEQGNLLELVDPRMGSDYNTGEMLAMINVALLCTNANPAARPAMSSVVSMLEGRANIEELVTDSSNFPHESNSRSMKKLYQHLEEKSAPESQTHSVSTIGPWTSSSTSAADLYPVTLTSDYWQNRD